jgi:hypothetical protein
MNWKRINMDEKVRKFIELCNSDGYKEGEYCVILFTELEVGLGSVDRVTRIYRNLKEFETRVENDIKKINTNYGLNFQVWLYD